MVQKCRYRRRESCRIAFLDKHPGGAVSNDVGNPADPAGDDWKRCRLRL
jgi:hypothetical protein